MALNRRQFIKRGVTFVALSLATRTLLMQTSNRGGTVFAQASNLSQENRLLVVVQLGGGNDGLNTVIPFENGLYYDARPTLAIPGEQVLPLERGLGLHPNLSNFKALYDEGKLAVLEGVGYPNPNRSHFRSTDIWETANPETVVGTGWLGRYLDATCESGCGGVPAAAVGRGRLPLTLRGEQVVVPAIQSLESFQFQTNEAYPDDREPQLEAFTAIQEAVAASDAGYASLIATTGLSAIRSAEAIQAAAAGYQSSVVYPENPFAQGLRLVAQLISGGLSTQVIHVQIGGFDTHAQQAATHAQLLAAVDAGLSAFYQDLSRLGVAEDTLIMTFSEFGRRVRENGSQGTDHGTAAPLFVLGNPVRGGLYGEPPRLTDLDDNGDLKFSLDFRSVYATVLENWLDVDPVDVLGGRFENLGFV